MIKQKQSPNTVSSIVVIFYMNSSLFFLSLHNGLR